MSEDVSVSGARQSDPLHENSIGARTLWSRTNAAEALPGVPTPLNWTLYGVSLEEGMRWSWYRLGILSRAEITPRELVDERCWGIFYGRVAINCDTWRMMGDRTPGTSGDAVEMQFFNTLRAGVSSEKDRRRYPLIVAKAPWAARSAATTLDDLKRDTDDWWREVAFGTVLAEPASARAVLNEACRRFDTVMRNHVLASLVAQGLFDQLQRLAKSAGHAGLELTLMTGYGGMDESRLTGDLVALAHGEIDQQTFLRSHGFHGPMENEVASWSWREEPTPLQALLPRYRALEPEAHPAAVGVRQKLAREEAVATLLANLGRLNRVRAKIVLKLAARYMPLREQGRATLMKTQDAVRAAARALGRDLVERSVLDDVDDVFYLTRNELVQTVGDGARELVAFRKNKRAEYQALDIPSAWEGPIVPPTAGVESESTRSIASLSGLGASPGVVEGVARVVLDPGEELDAGEILVCSTTDPGWTPLFLVASAAVVDIGGAMSHGPIVAREFGLPCVINTVVGTRELRTGDRIRVDGTAGTVEILQRAPAAEPAVSEPIS
jgi:phosphohistidine swiveling domain-containing protein